MTEIKKVVEVCPGCGEAVPPDWKKQGWEEFDKHEHTCSDKVCPQCLERGFCRVCRGPCEGH
jgi:hypothetical protein